MNTANHKRLSKLLIMIARSKEIIESIEDKALDRFESLKTSVYTEKAISMKYRGEWDLLERLDNKLIYKTYR